MTIFTLFMDSVTLLDCIHCTESQIHNLCLVNNYRDNYLRHAHLHMTKTFVLKSTQWQKYIYRVSQKYILVSEPKIIKCMKNDMHWRHTPCPHPMFWWFVMIIVWRNFAFLTNLCSLYQKLQLWYWTWCSYLHITY